MTDLRLSPSGPFVSVPSSSPLGRVYDVTQAPYGAVPNDPAAAVRNTLAFMAAIAAASADGGGGIVWIPPHQGGYYLAANGLGPNADGVTSALRLTAGVTLLGGGPHESILHYSAAAGPYDALLDNTTTAYTGVKISNLGLLGEGAASFGIKLRLVPYLQLDSVYAAGCLAAGIAIDDSFELALTNCDVGNAPQIGLALGAYGSAGNAIQIVGLKGNYFGKVGLFLHDATDVVVSNCSIGVGSGAAIFAARVQGLLIQTPRFERNNSDPADGLVFTNLAGPTKCDVWFHRGTFDTSTPGDWTFTLDPLYPPGSGVDEALYNNPGVAITGGSFSSTISPDASIAGNAATGLVLTSNVHEGAPAPLYGFLAANLLGYAMRWTEADNTGFLPSVTLSDPSTFLWNSTNLSDVCETRIQGVPAANLIGEDTLGSLTSRFANDVNAGNGELYYDTSAAGSYQGRPIFIFGGGDTPAAKGLTLDLDGSESYLRGELIYVAATIEVTLPASDLVAASFIVVGGPGRPLIFGSENYVNGWQTRAQILRLPTSGKVGVGFSKLGTAPGVRARDLVIAQVGAPYSEVVTASAGQKTSRRSMWIQPYYANASESYADGAGFICGVPMIGKNSAHAAVPLATTPGAGLVIVPKPGVASVFNNTTDTAPAIALNLASLIPGYTVDKHIAVRCVNSVATLTADGQDQALVAWTGGSPLTGAAIFRGQNGAIGFYVQAWAGGVLQQNALSAAALSAANSGLVLDSVTPGANLSAGYFEAANAAGKPDETTRASLNSTLSANNWSPFGLASAGIAALVGASKISGATAGASFTFPAICLQWET